MRILPCGDRALLVELDDLDEVLALYEALREGPPDGVIDMVPAARTLLLRTDGREPAAIARTVRTTDRTARRADLAGELVEIPVVYDGEDLADVAELTGLTTEEVVKAHTAVEQRVAFCGFAPGFGYLVGGDPRLHVPRRTASRTRVPAGAVGLAGEFSGVYPRESPGGWQLIGHTSIQTFDPGSDPPALLRPGVRVRFVEA